MNKTNQVYTRKCDQSVYTVNEYVRNVPRQNLKNNSRVLT
jgi:hypothetical protein